MKRNQTTLAVALLPMVLPAPALAAPSPTGRWSHADPTALPLNLSLSNR